MRVISGRYKGRNLTTVRDLSVRPATDRVKQTLFDMLATRIELEGASVLDLFAGSGNLGIEALSRGARCATFVEDNSDAVERIERNLRALGCESQTEIHETDVLSFIKHASESYDLIFADPPYAYAQVKSLPALIVTFQLLRPQGYLLIEHTQDLHFETTPLYLAGPEKKFGRTVVTFFRPITS
ncbi:MAG: 16S rRNA (guanine(966)-N(2))-methyltransferase RsmD [Ignavibacteriae bacterium]|nr:16S rRNA (guanine(966)-N(2))-methyltransferase RsmD [Ignavibacteriota bacterium]